MSFDGLILVACNDHDDPRLADLSTALGKAVVPVRPAEVAPIVASGVQVALLIVDEPTDPSAIDALTGVILSSDRYLPVVRLWSAAAAQADRPTSLWLDHAAAPAEMASALQRVVRLRNLLLEASRREQVVTEAAFGAPNAIEPWGNPREASILVIDTGLALPHLAPTCAERGLAIVGAPTLGVGSAYLDLRAFDALVIGPDMPDFEVVDFVAWLRDDPRRRDMPVFRLLDKPPTRRVAANDVDTIALRDPRLPAAVFAATRLHALGLAAAGCLAAMDVAGLADPDTGAMWPDAFRAALAQTLAWSRETDAEVHIVRVAPAAHAHATLPQATARLTARLLRRSDLITRYPDGIVLAALVGADAATASRIATRLASVIRHTALAALTQPALDVDVACFAPLPNESARHLIDRLLDPAAANTLPRLRSAG